jgi:broad specificity phosphatase PhoE
MGTGLEAGGRPAVTTTFHLVRHAAHERVGSTLCGRMPGVRLGAVGREQAARLARRFANENIAAVQSSPLERAQETAQPIAEALGHEVERAEASLEIDFGSWSGRSFEELANDPGWGAWNAARAVNRPPGGESMLEAQARFVSHLERMRAKHSGGAVVLVSHSDVIKAGLLYHLGLPIDGYQRIEIEPASISTLAIGDWGSKVIRLNEVVAA